MVPGRAPTISGFSHSARLVPALARSVRYNRSLPGRDPHRVGCSTRTGFFGGVESHVTFPGAAPISEHARDAVVCAVAGMEYLAGRIVAPRKTQLPQARQEGWTWAGPPTSPRIIIIVLLA